MHKVLPKGKIPPRVVMNVFYWVQGIEIAEPCRIIRQELISPNPPMPMGMLVCV